MMRAVSAEPVTTWTPSPWFLTTAPQAPEAVVERPRVIERIAGAVAARRLTTIAAPAGFGKTVALSAWARRHDQPVAWLSLTRFDRDPARLLRGVLSALHVTAAQWGLDGGAIVVPELDDAEAGYEAIAAVAERGERPIALVVDDAHLAGDALGDGALGALIAHGPPQLRLVLAGQQLSGVPLDRLRLAGAAEAIGAAELAFTAAEIAAAATAIGRPIGDDEAAELRAASGGWPAAVRLALMPASRPVGAGAAPQRPAAEIGTFDGSAGRLADYVAETILAALDPDLAEFVLAATTCSRLDAGLASALAARADGGELLEQCVRRGLFLDRFRSRAGTTVYRWHAVFAEQCRAILQRRDPAATKRLNRVAAERLATAFPLEAIVHALRAEDPQLAAATIASSWLGLVIESQASALDRQCAALPDPWAADPEILAIRACCKDVLGDRDGAALLFARATAREAAAGDRGDGRARLTTTLTQLFVADDHVAVAAAADDADALLREATAIAPSTYACGLFLLGWTELRLRRDPARAVRLLRSAARECELAGHETVAARASANLAFALAFGGALNAARSACDRGARRAPDERSWTYDGGIAAMTVGFADYWQDDLAGAEEALLRAAAGGGRVSYSALARVFLVLVACASRDPRRQAAAEAELRGVSDIEAHGVPWPAYKLLARAKLAEARGLDDQALALARQVAGVRHIPMTTVMLAELHRRAGEPAVATQALRTLTAPEQTSYVRASALLTSALLNRSAGRVDVAHRLLEESLAAAAPESIARPYGDPDPDLAALLRDHAAWGTRHEAFLAARIARLDAASPARAAPGAPLSPREREILGLLRTTMTTAEIAAALHLSLNTVKTHQRAIYRKLGVSTRRDAVKTR